MKPNYLQPKTIDALVTALETLTPASKILGGGTDLIPALRNTPPSVDTFLSLSHLPDCSGIVQSGDALRIGAMVTHTEIAENPLVNRYFKALAMASATVGSKQIRNKGTIGGSLVNANPAGDMAPCVNLFDGEVEIFSKDGCTRRVKNTNFISGVGKTCCHFDEIVLAIWLPIKPDIKSRFVKLGSRKEVTIAQISMALSIAPTTADTKKAFSLWLGAVDKTPLFVPEVCNYLTPDNLSTQTLDAFSHVLTEKIRKIREARSRQPKLRILDAEKVYKEFAVKSVLYDVFDFPL